EMVCEPMLHYGSSPASWAPVEIDQEGSCALDAADGAWAFRLFSDVRLGIEGNRAHGRHTMVEGEKRFCALSWANDRDGPLTAKDAQQRLDATEHFWRTWMAEGVYPDHP